MPYTPFLSQWKNTIVPKNRYEEYVFQSTYEEFLEVISDWSQKNGYQILEKGVDSFAVVKKCKGNFNVQYTACLIGYNTNPIRLQVFFIILDKYEDVINGNFKEKNIGNLIGGKFPQAKEILALVKALS